MENNQEQLTLSKEMRDKYINKIDILEKVKELFLLGTTELTTIEQVSNYYEVSTRQIERLIESNRDELLSDGFKVFKAEDFKTDGLVGIKNIETTRGKFTVRFNDDTEKSFSPKGITLFTKRAILRIGMLLRDSEIAKEVRTQLLNIEEVTQVEVKENIIDTETGLLVDIIKSYGDQMQLAIATGKYKEYTDRHRKALEMERDILVGQVINWNPQAIINNLIRRIGGRIFRGDFNKAWEKLWAELLYKHNIGVRSRITKSKKEKARTFDVLYPAEVQKALECTIALCNMYKIDITDVMIHNNDVKQIEA
jgi:hypothetical protein